MVLLLPLVDALTSVAVREGEQGETEGRRMVRYPDTQQLFVGNVPHDVDKMELKEFFERETFCFAFSHASSACMMDPLTAAQQKQGFGIVAYQQTYPATPFIVLINRGIGIEGVFLRTFGLVKPFRASRK